MRTTWMLLAVASACGGSTPSLIDGSTSDAAHADGAQTADAAVDAGPPDAGALRTYVYVSGVSGVNGFSAGAGGALTALPGTWPVPTTGNSLAIAVHPSGKFLYTADYDGSSVSAFAIDGATGALAPIDQYPAVGGAAFAAMDPKGRVLYVAGYATGVLSTFTIDGTTGALTSSGSIAVTPMPRGIAIDPQAQVLAIAGYTVPGRITICTLDANGVPTAVDQDPAMSGRQDLVSGNDPVMTAIDATATHVYATDSGGSTLHAFTVDSSTGIGTALAAPATGGSPLGLAIAPSGSFLYTADYSVGIGDYTIGADGTPAAIAATSYPYASARALGFDASGAVLYATTDGSITPYTVDVGTGALTKATTVNAGVAGGYTIAVVTR